MNNNDKVLELTCRTELENGLYDYEINGIPIFNYLKRYYRRSALNQANGSGLDYGRDNKVSLWEHVKMLFCYNKHEWKSLKQIVSVCLSSTHYDNFVFSIMRKEIVDGMYVDKFTDSLIDNSNIKQSYIIFERSFQGGHPSPRYHSDKIIFDDVLWKIAKLKAFFWGPIFNKRYKKTLDGIIRKIDTSFPTIYHTKSYTLYYIHYNYVYTKLYYWIFKKLKIKRLIAPSRADFLQLIPAAKLNGIEVIELQHGITYGESMTYSGYRDNMFIPDVFLSFGKLHPSDVYGIDQNKIIEIGWAFSLLVENQMFKKLGENEVLVISEPNASSQILKSIIELAEKNPHVIFHFRTHPIEEKLSKEQREKIDGIRNIVLDDNRNSSFATIMKFQHVVGVNSTALYEALSIGKKVGNLYMNGLNPSFLQEDDEKCFWAIKDDKSFKSFLADPKTMKQSRSIYSRFNPDLVNSIIA